jgi:hypothetical protein
MVWWVLIAVGVVALGFIKIKVWNSIKRNRSKKQSESEE